MSQSNIPTQLISYAVPRSAIGTFAISSDRIKPDRGSRPYGGTNMSRARLFATRPTQNIVAQRTSDITM
jgi:hypothetical protein